MAAHRGIESTSQAVVELLHDNYDPVDFNRDREFRVLSVGGFENGLTAGVSVFGYRVMVGDAPRTPAGTRSVAGAQLQAQLSANVHFILTGWAPDASLRQDITGWMMRAMDDHRVLPPGLFDRMSPGGFRDDETVEVLEGVLVTEDQLHLWELLGTVTPPAIHTVRRPQHPAGGRASARWCGASRGACRRLRRCGIAMTAIESVQHRTPLAVAFHDSQTDAPITDGLVVSGRRAERGSRFRAGHPISSGVHVLSGLPVLRDAELSHPGAGERDDGRRQRAGRGPAPSVPAHRPLGAPPSFSSQARRFRNGGGADGRSPVC
jgi:hypothetical protein